MFSILQASVPALNFAPFFLMNAKHLRGIFFGAFSAACYGLNAGKASLFRFVNLVFS